MKIKNYIIDLSDPEAGGKLSDVFLESSKNFCFLNLKIINFNSLERLPSGIESAIILSSLVRMYSSKLESSVKCINIKKLVFESSDSSINFSILSSIFKALTHHCDSLDEIIFSSTNDSPMIFSGEIDSLCELINLSLKLSSIIFSGGRYSSDEAFSLYKAKYYDDSAAAVLPSSGVIRDYSEEYDCYINRILSSIPENNCLSTIIFDSNVKFHFRSPDTLIRKSPKLKTLIIPNSTIDVKDLIPTANSFLITNSIQKIFIGKVFVQSDVYDYALVNVDPALLKYKDIKIEKRVNNAAEAVKIKFWEIMSNSLATELLGFKNESQYDIDNDFFDFSNEEQIGILSRNLERAEFLVSTEFTREKLSRTSDYKAVNALKFFARSVGILSITEGVKKEEEKPDSPTTLLDQDQEVLQHHEVDRSRDTDHDSSDTHDGANRFSADREHSDIATDRESPTIAGRGHLLAMIKFQEGKDSEHKDDHSDVMGDTSGAE